MVREVGGNTSRPRRGNQRGRKGKGEGDARELEREKRGMEDWEGRVIG